jgi:hypothetical protein
MPSGLFEFVMILCNVLIYVQGDSPDMPLYFNWTYIHVLIYDIFQYTFSFISKYLNFLQRDIFTLSLF